MFFEDFMVGTFWVLILGVYATVLFIRLTVWAIRTVRR